MSNGVGVAQSGIRVMTGAVATALFALRSSHVCQLPRTLTFATARSFVEPTAENKAALSDLLTRLGIPSTLNRLLIVGHTDAVGNRASNQALSERRTQAVQAVLQGNTAQWETTSGTEGWGTPELAAMVTEVGETDVSRYRGPANRTARLDLYQRYFARLLGGATVPTITPTTPPLLGCGQDQLLHGSRSSPSRDTSLPPIQGEFRPNRRVEFFFFDGASTPIACSEYPTWTIICSLTAPPPPAISVTIAHVETVRKNGSAAIHITLNPTPLPTGTTITLALSTVGGAGEARFASGAATQTITASGPVTVRGVTVSDTVDNIRLSATVTGQSTILAQEDFTVVEAFSFFLQFEVWNLSSHAFEPLPPGVDVDLMDKDPASNDRIARQPTNARGRVFFNLPDLSASGETNPDLFFLVHTNRRSHAGHTLPPQWSTDGWEATDGTPGLQPRFTGHSLGTPTTPLVFRIGLDFHAQLKYHVDAGRRAGTDDPAPAGVLCQLMQEETGPDRELLSLRTDADGKLEGVSFDAQAGRTFYLKVVFEMEDSSIHLKRSRFSTVPLVPPLIDVVTPAGSTMEWDSNTSDNDRHDFPSHTRTSIGTAGAPRLFRCSLSDRNVALHILKVLREEGMFFFRMTGGDWGGVEVAVTPTAPVRGFSWPPGRIQLKFPDERWDRETVSHEMSHQVMWEMIDTGGAGILYQIILRNLVLNHSENLMATETQALIEGWAEFVAAIFEGVRTPPYRVSSLIDTSENPVTGGLGPPPNNRGEKVEGAFANGLWAIFQNEVVTRAVASNAHVPESINGDITATTARAYLGSTPVRDRFLSIIWNPLKDMRPLSTPQSTDMIDNIRSRNLSDWHRLQPELQA